MTKQPDDLEQLLAEQPFVRALAQRLVADEADDVVQDALLRALEQRPTAITQLRAWLARIVRNVAVDRCRRAARRDTRHHEAYQRSAAVQAHVPSSSELLIGEERRRELVAAVDALPPEQRTVVLLRYYDGMPPRRIAAELGVPVTRVRNRLHAAMQSLRARLDSKHGDRRAWLLPLVPFATKPRSLPWRELAAPAAKTVLEGLAMTTKAKMVTLFASVLVIAAAWAAWPDALTGQTTRASDSGLAAASGTLVADRSSATAADPSRRQPTGAPAHTTSTTGALAVRVRYADEPRVAAGVTIHAIRAGSDLRLDLERALTDADGLARFRALSPGTWYIRTSAHAAASVRAEITAGSTTECTLDMLGGMTLTGVVVDASGATVAGAIVEAVMASATNVEADQVAITAADGTFTIRECFEHCLVGARAEGHAASNLYYREGRRGDAAHVRIELLPNGGTVAGVVLDPGGVAVADAVVRIGEGSTNDIRSTDKGAAPLPAQVRTDAEGRFRAIGVPAGTQPLQVRAANLLPWHGTCEVVAAATVTMQIGLAPGITCEGIVRDAGGQPVADAHLEVGNDSDFIRLRTRSAADGTFALRGVPGGEFTIAAAKEHVGATSTRLHGRPGAALRCELQLGLGLALRARVVDMAGAPMVAAEVRVEAEGTGPSWHATAFPGEDGRILIGDCPPGRTLALHAQARDAKAATATLQGIAPGGPEFDVRLILDTAPKARITGRLLRPDGSAAAGETVWLTRMQSRTQLQLELSATVGPDGSFLVEAPAGEWQGGVRLERHPEIRFTTGRLEAGGAFDCGTLQLTIGGTLVVHVDGFSPTNDVYSVLDVREKTVGSLWGPANGLLESLLAPGDYLLLAQAEGLAPQLLPFTIQSTRETSLTVQRRAGVRQWIEFEFATGASRPPWIEFEVRQGPKLAARSHARGEAGAPFRREVWLAPGNYTLATRNREPQAGASFTVGDHEGTAVRVLVP